MKSLRSQMHARVRAIWQIARSRPHVWVIPVLVVALVIGGGIPAVLIGARSSADAAKTKAGSLARSSASALQLSIQNAISPAVALQDWIKHTRNVSVLRAHWLDRVPDWWAMAPNSSFALSMAPNGWVADNYPPYPPAPAELIPTVLNLLEPGVPGFNFSHDVLHSMREHKTLAIGPLSDYGRDQILLFQLPVFLTDVSKEDTYGLEPNPFCPPGLCYDPTTRTRWWGVIASMVLCEALIKADALNQITGAGYQMQILRTPIARHGETEWQNVILEQADSNVTQATDAVTADLPVADQTWRLFIWQDSWEPSWKWPLVAVVVVVGVLCGVLVFAVLLSWEEHRLLLLSILPKATINRMKENMDWQKVVKNDDNLKMIEIETPAQHMLTIIKTVMAGDIPPMSTLVAVQQALQRSQDVYRPANQELQSMMRNATDMDEEVQLALVAQLAGHQPRTNSMGPAPATGRSADMDEDGADNLTGCGVVTPRASQQPHRVAALECDQVHLSDDRWSTRKQPLASAELVEAVMAFGNKDAAATTEAVPAPLSVIPAAASLHLDFLVPTRPILDTLDRVLATANSWNFDAYALEEASEGHPLSVLGYWIMQQTGCMEFASINGTTLARFLRKIESGYKTNAYHNKRHAADVLQTYHMVLQQGGLTTGYVDSLTLLGCYLAAVVHDYEHVGRSNDYLVNTKDVLAVRYNDKSPMENHHLAAAWELLLQPEYNFLDGLSKSQWEKLRKLVIDLVLATDMRQHFAIMGQFAALYPNAGSSNNNINGPNLLTTSVSSSVSSMSSFDTVMAGIQVLTPTNDNDRLLTLQVALKCADLGHLAAPLPVHLKWVSGLEEELFLQGDSERARGLPISPLCDRTKEGVTKSQVGFMEFVVLPLYTNFCGRYTHSRPLLKAVIANYHYWKGKAAPGAHKETAKERVSVLKEDKP